MGRRPRGPAKRRGLVGALVTAIALAGVLGAGSAVAAGWVAPLPGPLSVSHAFERPTTAYGAGHRGVDLRGTTGESVRAAGPGRVSYAGLLAGRGVVVVQHAAGLRTTYEPVSATVRVGQSIGSGAPLGRLAIGHSGCPGTCLHWGLLRGQTYLDPLSLLGTTHVRLLPSGTMVAGKGSPDAGGPGPVRHEATQLSGITGAVPGRPVVRVRPAAAPRLTLRSADRPWGWLPLSPSWSGWACWSCPDHLVRVLRNDDHRPGRGHRPVGPCPYPFGHQHRTGGWSIWGASEPGGGQAEPGRGSPDSPPAQPRRRPCPRRMRQQEARCAPR